MLVFINKNTELLYRIMFITKEHNDGMDVKP